jgi:hypothetical protein
VTAPQVTAASSAQASQSGLLLAIGPQLEAAWQLLDVADLERTLPRFKLAVAALVQRYGAASRTLAAQFYRAQRLSAGVGGRAPLRPAPLPDVKRVDRSIGWATKGLWAPNPDVEAARTLVGGVTDALMLDAGRQTIIDSVHADQKATGWARIPEPGCCFFCALLAARGEIYKDGAAFELSDKRFANHVDTPSVVKVHNKCRCHVEPVFTAYEPTAQIRQWQKLYTDSTAGPGDKLWLFRRAYEGRA